VGAAVTEGLTAIQITNRSIHNYKTMV